MEHREQITEVGNGLVVLAPAKINLSLLVGGMRDDGFHEIETIITKVNFYDEILIERGVKSGIELICEGPRWAPEGKDNLVYRACEKLLEHRSCNVDLRVRLRKNIPAGSGLGSASSDAAAALIGVNKMLGFGIGREDLSLMASGLGSDVPFFFGGPLAFCTGRGERIRKIGEIFNFLAILVLPDITVSTKTVYEKYEPDEMCFVQLKKEINDFLAKNRIDFVAKMCTNMLEKSCFALKKGLAELKSKLEFIVRGRWCLSGSGSAMYCILEGADERKASEYQRQITERIGNKSIIINNNRW